jgi:hypothetical protein
MGGVSDQSYRLNKNAQFVLSNFFPPENLAVYELMCKNMLEPDNPQITN